MRKKSVSPIPNKEYVDKTLQFINTVLFNTNSLNLQTNLEIQTNQILRKKIFEINCKITKMFDNINLIKEIREKYRIASIKNRARQKRYEDAKRQKGIKRRRSNKANIVMPIIIKNAKPQIKIILHKKTVLSNPVPELSNKVLSNPVPELSNKVLANKVLTNKVLHNNISLLANTSVADIPDMCPNNLLDFMYCFNS
jgi:hypothetical protein